MTKVLSGIILALTFGVPLYGAKIEVFTADNIVQMIKNKISQTKTFTGSFVYAVNSKTSWGVIKFKSPNKFLLNYMASTAGGGTTESGQKFVSDGKNLWLVFRDQNVAINETLARDKSSPLIGWNINRLQKEYIPTLPKSGYRVKYGNAEAFKIVFVPKSNTAGFKSVGMVVAESGDILKIEAVNQVGSRIELGIKYESFNQPLSEDNFTYEPDENTQIYENILLPKGQGDTPEE